MFYHLFYPLSSHSIVFNLLRYITFRSIAAFFTAFAVGILIAPWFIRKLHELKFGQEVRSDGPQTHLVKQGTPTMGGIFIIAAAASAIALWCKFNYYVLVVGLSMLLFALVGFMDDFLKIKEKSSKGVSAKLKLIFQIAVSALLVFLLSRNPERDNTLADYSLNIRDSQNRTVQTFDMGTNVVKNFMWDGKNTEDTSVPAGTYGIVMTVQDKSGNLTEEQVTNFYWAADYGLLEVSFTRPAVVTDASAVPSTNVSAIRNAGNLREWKLTFYGMDYATAAEWKGSLSLPKPPDIFLSFYVPFYSKPVFEWPWWLAVLFYIFALVSFANATNLSDGLDGLASGMGIILYIPFGIFAYVMGNAVAASYLLFPYLEGVGEVSVILTAMMGGYAAFLWHNVHPAEVFMGDTGSLAMGGTIATVAIILKSELVLVIAGFMFVLEAVSVVLQVFWFKNFNKRIFKMAPIHHHFELSGWKETQVVPRFWILATLFALIALSTLKIR